jgi:hypothetical protein
MSDAMTKEEAAQFEEMRRADSSDPPREPEPTPEPEPQREPPPEPREPPPPAPEVETLDEPEPMPEADATGRVDKRALDEARRNARAAREQLQREQREHTEAMARLDERFRMLAGAVEQHNAQQQAPPPQQQIPDFNSDPAGHWEGRFRQQEQQLRSIAERQAQNEQTTRQERELADLQNWGVAQENAFARETPDYAQATAYLRDARSKMLRVMGEQDERKIEQQVLLDVASMAVRARSLGLNFGKSLYDLAVAHGYQPGRGNGAAQGNGQQAGNVSSGGGLSPAERLARGNDMATTLGATGGAPRGEPSAAHIAAMNEEEFNRYYAQVQKQGGAALRNLLGA